MGLGDLIESALSKVGVTKERVEKWLGRPCNCEERKQKLNSLSFWARRVVNNKIELCLHYLHDIMGSNEK